MELNFNIFRKLAPPDSFLHIENFTSMKHLGNYILHLDKSPSAYEQYHKWRTTYDVCPSMNFICKLCVKLHINDFKVDQEKYKYLSKWWSFSQLCKMESDFKEIVQENITLIRKV